MRFRSCMSSVAQALLVVTLLPVRDAKAQSPANLTVWQGAKGGAITTRWSLDGRTEAIAETRGRRYVEPGDSVCVVVHNAHPVFYAYSTAAETLKVVNSLPAAPLLEELARLGAGFKAFGLDNADWDDVYLSQLGKLALTLQTARAIGVASDAADDPGASGSNFLRAVASIRSLLDTIPERQPGEHLQRTLDRWYQDAKAGALRDDSKHPRLLEALQGYGAGLLAQAQVLERSWTAEGAPYRSCVVVNREPVRLRVSASVRDDDNAKARRIGTIAEIDVIPKYRENNLTVTPAFTLSLSEQGEPNYQVQSGALVDLGDSDNLLPQSGAIVSMLVTQWGADASYLLRVGLGSNIVRSNDRLSRLFGAVTVGYRDVLALGFGVGRVRRQVLKDASILGKPLPVGAKLEDFLDKPQNRPTLYLTVSLANLDALSGLGKLIEK